MVYNAPTQTPRESGHVRAELRCNKCGAYSERPTPPPVEAEASFPNTLIVLDRKKLVISPETKNNYAGED
jgi:hypothetical protein